MRIVENQTPPHNEHFDSTSAPVQAIIDIGTNTVLILVGYRQDDRIVVLDEAQEIPRIGKGVDAQGVISKAAIGRLLRALAVHKQRLEAAFGEIPVRVTATSAMRDATNREEILRQIYTRFGWRVEVLHGTLEAEAGFSGALSMLPHSLFTPGQSVSVIDIGGGSTELSFGRAAHSKGPAILEHRFSVNAGAVRFTERYLNRMDAVGGTVAMSKNADTAVRHMSRAFSDMVPRPVPACDVLVGVAGTVTSLAYMLSGASSDYDARQFNGMVVSVDRVNAFMRQAQDMGPDELLRRWPVVMTGRSDIFLAGLVLLHTWMKLAGHDRLVVSTGGLRHGILAGKNPPGNLF